MSRVRLMNACWMASCSSEARHFAQDATRLRWAQEQVLLRTIRRNRDCWFGRQHDFQKVRSISNYRQCVPVASYDDFNNAIGRIGAGEESVLTAEPVLLLEPTSGTSDTEKLIPFTRSLRREFQRGIRAWIYDLFRGRPAIRQGRAYWSISPLARAERSTAGGLPIGFADDTSYLGTWERSIVRRTLAVPPQVALVPDVRDSRLATLFFLLQAEDLSLISVWSPTFLIELLRQLQEDWPRLCDGIQHGTLEAGGRSLGPFADVQSPPNRQRAEFLRSVFSRGGGWNERIGRIWPRLALVSSWADGASATYADRLGEMLPHVELQPKGLLATEAFVTLPWLQSRAAALAYRSHFFEFIPVADGTAATGDPLLADEIEEGGRYEVLVTTGGGLYRYRLCDQVEVVGRFFQVPLLKFLGRAGANSDLVGEKLTEAQAAAAIHRALNDLHIQPSFVCLTPQAGPPARYCLTIAASNLDQEAEIAPRLARRLDRRLQQYPGYRYARDLGQLETIEIEVPSSADADHWARYERTCLASGQRLGDVKAKILHLETGQRQPAEIRTDAKRSGSP